MHTHAFAQGRRLIQMLIDDWPGPACDAIDGARIYLAYSCPACGVMLWPEHELLPLSQRATPLCPACQHPHILKFVESDLLLETLQELIFAWPPLLRGDGVDAATAYLRQYAPEIV